MFPLERHGSTLADVGYLTRSPNRVCVLSVLAKSALERRELAEATGITRPTLGRILDELVERGWVTREGRTYHVTPVGAFLVGEFETFIERLRPVTLLDSVARWFPQEGFEFDIDRLATAEVVITTPTNVLAPIRRVIHELRCAAEVQVLSPAVLPSAIEASHDRTVNGDQRVVAVVTTDVVASIREDPALSATLDEMLASGQVEVFSDGGTISYPLLLTDDRVTIILSDPDGAPHAAICSDDEVVRSWAGATVERRRAEATRLPTTAFAV